MNFRLPMYPEQQFHTGLMFQEFRLPFVILRGAILDLSNGSVSGPAKLVQPHDPSYIRNNMVLGSNLAVFTFTSTDTVEASIGNQVTTMNLNQFRSVGFQIGDGGTQVNFFF